MVGKNFCVYASMTEAELFSAVRAVLQAGLGDGTRVRQKYQPTRQGTPLDDYVTVYRVSGYRHGHPARFDRWNEEKQVMEHVESQHMVATLQVTGYAITDPDDITKRTAYDLAQQACDALQSDGGRQALWDQYSVGLQRVTDIRTPFFQDDQGLNEMAPSFDLVVTYNHTRVTTTPTLTSIDFQVRDV